MSNPYVGEIRMFGGNFAPSGWLFCEGQLLPISQYDVLFSLIGTTYGGDGQSTFALPDLRGRVPVHMGTSDFGTGYTWGSTGGAEAVALTVDGMASHRHAFASTFAAARDTPVAGVLASPANGTLLYAGGGTNGTLGSAANAVVGASQPHNNLMPYLCTSFIISLFGIFPSQN